MLTNKNKSQAELNRDLFNVLYWGKREHEKEEIENLLKQGADVNALNNDGRTPLHQAVLIRNITAVRELLINGADVNIKDCDGMTPFALYIRSNIKKQLTLSKMVIYLFLAFGANSSDVQSDNSILKEYIKEFEALKRYYPHCAKLIEANKNSDLQYNEDTKKLDEEFKNIKIREFNNNDKVISNALQDLRQYVLQKSNGTKAISTSESSATVSTNAEASLKRKIAHNDQTNNNLPLKKRKFQESLEPCVKSSNKLTIPSIPDKLISILEVMHYREHDMFSQRS